MALWIGNEKAFTSSEVQFLIGLDCTKSLLVDYLLFCEALFKKRSLSSSSDASIVPNEFCQWLCF